jgi:hypothetical protein
MSDLPNDISHGEAEMHPAAVLRFVVSCNENPIKNLA